MTVLWLAKPVHIDQSDARAIPIDLRPVRHEQGDGFVRDRHV
jgi:hypothetical protein